jgi:hypothetical protein
MLANSAFATKLASANAAEARIKVVRLFRAALREADSLLKNYQLDLTRTEMRDRIKQEFAKHYQVKDTRVVDLLVFKGTTELEEAKLLWKTKSHVVRFFVPERAGRSAAEMRKIVKKKEQEWAENAKLEAKAETTKSIPSMFWADKTSTHSL